MTRSSSVLVALSGGVDSAIAAYRLQQQGYEVTGITFRLWKPNEELSDKQIARARAVCDRLGIHHVVVDLRRRFEECIIKNFVDEYFAGKTPNPCVACNRWIKWAELKRIADEQRIDLVATGHYARVIYDPINGRYQILQARDKSKDQSYALWRLDQESLARTLWPLGDMSKTEVKSLATATGLFQGPIEESQDICFIPDNDYRKFLTAYAPDAVEQIGAGEIVTENGEVVGTHDGFYNFTIGQRKGLRRGFRERMYVKRIEPEHNRVVISEREGLMTDGLIIKEVNFVSQPPAPVFTGEVKIRYGSKGVKGEGRQLGDGRYEIRFKTPQTAVCPGQSAVVYEGERLLLGGLIEREL